MEGIDIIRNSIRDGIRSYLREPNPPTYNLHLNQFAGAGKTTLTIEELENNDQLFLYLTNNHTIASEQIKNQKGLFDLLQIESRRRLCQNEQYKVLADNGINIKQFCPNCSVIQTCDYYQRILEIWKEPQSWVGVHNHLGGLVNAYVNEMDVDVVVLDEYFLPSIFKHTVISYNLIAQSLNIISMMRDCHEKHLMIDFMQEFAFALQNKAVNNIFLWAQIRGYFTHGSPMFLLAFAEEYEERLAHYYFNKGKIFTNIITPLCDAINDINARYIPITMPRYLDYMNSVIIAVIGDQRRYIDISRYDLEALNINCKVMILDATTPVSFYQKVFTRQVRALEKQIAINSTIYQLVSAKYCMRTLDKSEKTRKRLYNIVDLITKKHEEPVLVLSRKKYENDIKAINPAMITTDHYPLVGSNEYEKINVCVIFGTPEPSRDMLERQSILLQCDQNELHYILRETNILQGIHRIRPTLKLETPTYIYLLTSITLPFNHIKAMPIGKLEKLLRGEGTAYVTEETEDRIREDVLTLLEESDKTITEITNTVKGNHEVISEVVKRLVNDDMIELYKDTEIRRGRKTLWFRIKKE